MGGLPFLVEELRSVFDPKGYSAIWSCLFV